MPANEYGTFAVGRATFPLTASTANSLLQDADPPLYWLLDFFAGVLSIHTQARFASEAARAGLSATIPNVVGSKFPNSPFPFLQDTSITFPLLAVNRVEGKITEKTISFYRIESILEASWTLPALTMSQTEILGPFLNVVMNVLADRAEYGFDAHYLDGYNVGQATGFDSLQMIDYTIVMIPHTTTNLPLQSVVMKFRLRERNMPVPGEFELMTGADTEIDLLTQSDGYIANFVDLNSNDNPTNFPG